jgi:hypothetical protein
MNLLLTAVAAVMLGGSPFIIPAPGISGETVLGSGSLTLNDDVQLYFGTSQDSWLQWNTTETPDSLFVNAGEGDLRLVPGIAPKVLTMTAANCAGGVDTVTTTVDFSATVKTETADFDCSGTDDACAAALAAQLTAVTGVTATALTNVVTVLPDNDTETLLLATSDATCAAITGTDAKAFIGGYAGLQFANGAVSVGNTCGQPDRLCMRSQSTYIAEFNVSAFTLGNNIGVTLVGPSGFIYNANSMLDMGGAMATTHGLGTGDVGVAGELEVDGNTWLDGRLYMGSNLIMGGGLLYLGSEGTGMMMVNSLGPDPDVPQFGLPTASLQLQLISRDHNNDDYGHALQSNPTLFIHSVSADTTATDEWISFTHDVTDGVIDVGSGNIKLADPVEFASDTDYLKTDEWYSTTATKSSFTTSQSQVWNLDAVGDILTSTLRAPQGGTGATPTLRFYVSPDTSNAPANTETIIFDVDVRTIGVGKDSTSAGTAYTGTYTQSGAGDANNMLIVDVILDEEDATNPIVANTLFDIKAIYDETSSTYNGTGVFLFATEIIWN